MLCSLAPDEVVCPSIPLLICIALSYIQSKIKYGFRDGEEICAADKVVWKRTPKECSKPCIYDIDTDATNLQFVGPLQCEYDTLTPDLGNLQSCACSCDDMVDIKRPSVEIMCLSVFSQACIACIVGFTLGYRHDFLDVWKTLIKGIVNIEFTHFDRSSIQW
jgi:hypothetical protein